MSTPRLYTVANHYLEAKEVKCLRSNIVVDVTYNDGYEWDEQSKSFTSIGGAITFWKDGVYAETLSVIKKKKCKCENCKCDEPKKQ